MTACKNSKALYIDNFDSMFLKAYRHHSILATSVLLLSHVAYAQDAANKVQASSTKATVNATVAKPTATSASAKDWSALTDSQKISLAPLESVWTNIPPVKKQKWLDMSAGYHLLSPEGQSTLHFRMKEWATLSKKQRGQVRQNFVQTKKLSPDDKQVKWQAYQALSPEEKLKLRKIHHANAVPGAAPALKSSALAPVAPTALAINPNKDESKVLLTPSENTR